MTKSFTLIKEQQIPEINSLVQLWEHKRTGARLLSVINDDENKVFGVVFKTPPADSTGIAHILDDLAQVCIAQGRNNEARNFWTRSLTVFREMENEKMIAEIQRNLATIR